MKPRLSRTYALAIISLVSVVVVVLSAAFFVQGAGIMSQVRTSTSETLVETRYRQVRLDGESLAQLLAETLVEPLYHLDMPLIERLSDSWRVQKDVIFVLVFDADHRILFDGSEDLSGYGNLIDDPLARASSQAGRALSRLDGEVLTVAAPARLGRRVLGGVWIGVSLRDVSRDLAALNDTLRAINEQAWRRLALTSLVIIGVFAGLGVGLGILVARRLSRPIEALVRMVRGIAAGRYDVGTEAGLATSVEFDSLVAAFRDMAEDLRRTTVSKSHVDRILGHMLDPLIVARENGTIIGINRAASALLGYRPEELEGRPLSAIVNPESAEADGNLPDLLKAGPFISECLALVRRDGTRIPALTSWAVIPGSGGDAEGIVCVARDITERRRTEEALKYARDQAELAVRSRTRFFAAASHDLRQPLQAINLLLGVLAQRFRNQPDLEKVIANVRASAEAMDHLLNGLLDVSKLEAGVVKPDFRDMDVGDVLRRIVAEYEPRAAAKGICMKLRMRLGHCPVNSDPMLLGRIVRNLVDNAVQHTRRGGVLLSCRHRGDRIRIEVWDTGPGIPRHEIANIFQEFHQLDNPERDRRKGLGLGLAVVQRLAALLNARIEVTSTVGRGARFSVDLPAGEPAEAPPADAGEKPLKDADGEKPLRGTIAVIEDDPSILIAMQALLERWGLRVVAAEELETALEAIDRESTPPCLVIADLRLRGGQTGIEAIERVRRRLGTRVPSLIITGDTDPQRLVEVNASGARLLHKPVTPETLRAGIEDLLRD